ncbi:MAG: hypothetical protein ACRDZ8_17905 [Acidimicrobiales bacterium]
MPSHEAGVQVTCPGCGRLVMLHSMIPLLGDGGQGIRYLCPPCARELAHPAAPNEALAAAAPASSEAESTSTEAPGSAATANSSG